MEEHPAKVPRSVREFHAWRKLGKWRGIATFTVVACGSQLFAVGLLIAAYSRTHPMKRDPSVTVADYVVLFVAWVVAIFLLGVLGWHRLERKYKKYAASFKMPDQPSQPTRG